MFLVVPGRKPPPLFIIIGTADVFGVVVCIEARLILGGMTGMYGSYMSYERGCLRGWV